MRFALLAASAVACAFSAPASAATWVFQVTTTFHVTGQATTVRCTNLPPSQCVDQVNIDQFVPQTYSFAIPSFAATVTGYNMLGSYAGYFLDARGSYIETHLRLANGNVYVDSASILGSSSCATIIGCTSVYLTATSANTSVVFVSATNGPGPVPEPATWAMMVAGFGIIGATMRRSAPGRLIRR